MSLSSSDKSASLRTFSFLFDFGLFTVFCFSIYDFLLPFYIKVLFFN